MINLLPDATKKEIRAARTNVQLVNYLILLSIGTLFLIAITGAIYFVLMGSKNAAETLIKTNESKATTYNLVQSQIATFNSSLAGAGSIISQSVSYSSVLTGIAAVMPAGTVLDNLTLTTATFGTTTTLNAHAKNNADALQLKENFQASPLFSNVTILTLSSSAAAGSAYPVAISLGLTINKAAAVTK